MDLARFLAVAGEPLPSRTPDVTRLDGFLLETASSHLDPEVRVRLIKFYAMFKIVEMLRYERFRGFPA